MEANVLMRDAQDNLNLCISKIVKHVISFDETQFILILPRRPPAKQPIGFIPLHLDVYVSNRVRSLSPPPDINTFGDN